MSTPKELFRRRQMQNTGTGEGRTTTGVSEMCPAPTAPEIHPAPEIRHVAEPDIRCPERLLVPQQIREKSVYRQLMRSHDRMSTRHIKG